MVLRGAVFVGASLVFLAILTGCGSDENPQTGPTASALQTEYDLGSGMGLDVATGTAVPLDLTFGDGCPPPAASPGPSRSIPSTEAEGISELELRVANMIDRSSELFAGGSLSDGGRQVVLSAPIDRWDEALAAAKSVEPSDGTLMLVSVPRSNAQLKQELKRFTWSERKRLGVEALSPDMRGYVKAEVAQDRIVRAGNGRWMMASESDQAALEKYGVGCIVPSVGEVAPG